MVLCGITVLIGFAVLLIGGVGGLKIAGPTGGSIAGGAGAVIIVIGILGFGC